MVPMSEQEFVATRMESIVRVSSDGVAVFVGDEKTSSGSEMCPCQRCDPEDSYVPRGVPLTDPSQLDLLTPRILHYPIIDVKEVASE